jgi:integrase
VEKAKHFFRRIARPTAQGKLKMSWEAQNIGKGKLADQGKFIAKLLGLPNWLQFTGHVWRRTAITWGANSGMTLPQLKAMSGHHSDSVCQVSLLIILHIAYGITI